MKTKFFDVIFTIHVNGFEKTGWSRTCADDPLEAVISAIADEVHCIEYEDVEEQVNECYRQHKSLSAINVSDDDEFIYEIDDVVELEEFPVKVNGEWGKVLVPVEGKQTRSRLPGCTDYFSA